jgi:hypothetical protein
MKNIVKAITINKEIVLINEEQVTTVMQGEVTLPENKRTAKVKMSNGDEFILASPDWDMWENDLFLPQ